MIGRLVAACTASSLLEWVAVGNGGYTMFAGALELKESESKTKMTTA